MAESNSNTCQSSSKSNMTDRGEDNCELEHRQMSI